jgi:hypothetical protein
LRLIQCAATVAAFLAATGATCAQESVTQAVRIKLIVCPSHAMEQPTLRILGAPAQYLTGAVATKGIDGTWTFSLRLPPGFYYLIADLPKDEHGYGCSHLQQFAVLPGHDRHLVGALAGSHIGGEGFDRSAAGTLPFENMVVTEQRLDYPMEESPVAVDGTIYDAESLGPHPYLLRFYLPGSEQYTSFEIDFRHTPSGSYLQRNLTLDDIRTGLRDAYSGPFWAPGGAQTSPTFQIFRGTGAAAQAIAVAFADLVKAKQLTGAAADLGGYIVDEKTQNPLPGGEKMLFFIEFIPKARIDENTHRLILDSGACVRDGRPHASYVVREDMVITERDLCVPNP